MSALVSRPKEELPVRSTTQTNLYFVTILTDEALVVILWFAFLMDFVMDLSFPVFAFLPWLLAAVGSGGEDDGETD